MKISRALTNVIVIIEDVLVLLKIKKTYFLMQIYYYI